MKAKLARKNLFIALSVHCFNEIVSYVLHSELMAGRATVTRFRNG